MMLSGRVVKAPSGEYFVSHFSLDFNKSPQEAACIYGSALIHGIGFNLGDSPTSCLAMDGEL